MLCHSGLESLAPIQHHTLFGQGRNSLVSEAFVQIPKQGRTKLEPESLLALLGFLPKPNLVKITFDDDIPMEPEPTHQYEIQIEPNEPENLKPETQS
ncbi:hypothetical protein QE152_g29006 [Popillia japonica]|uniref:Uncharacterized protein n=1 Tax=Popillia japonica TaxID=7064 RepID=A0AAW1JIY2_POPJA